MTWRRWTRFLSWLALASSRALPLAAQTPTPAPAAEQGPPPAARVHLSYVRGPGAQSCLAAEAIESAVEARLGRVVFVPEAQADLLARVTARRQRGQFAVDVQLFDASRRSLGRRQLRTRARHCSALDDSLALVLSLAADVHRPPASAAPQPVAPAALNTPLDIPPPAVAPREPWRVRPELGIALSAGLQPSPGVGLQARIEVVPPHFWALSLGASLWNEQRLGTSSGARFDVAMVELGICPWSFDLAPVELQLCAKQEFGSVSVEGFGFDQPDTSQEWLAAFGAGLVGKYWFGASFVSLSGSLLVPAVQRRYFFTDGAEVTLYEAPWLFGVGTIAVGFDL